MSLQLQAQRAETEPGLVSVIYRDAIVCPGVNNHLLFQRVSMG